ncbi:putative Ceramide-1-phosphate transfer protein [Hypsibius exemplaris]|uniref:Ceramide-1-phosphate transfer protein n=1 Tax=Hypsibius exemplaris TaxID=2072580 RepID=A0A9X6NJ49_HYPEX|nr:putative Ceramide-1-phosphate transfer protein [Hypsibius exemplaris]
MSGDRVTGSRTERIFVVLQIRSSYPWVTQLTIVKRKELFSSMDPPTSPASPSTEAKEATDSPEKRANATEEVDGLCISREAPALANGGLSFAEPFVPRLDGFDMEIVSVHFEKCLETDGVDMGLYIAAYRELERFFELMGSVFGFVGADIKDKLEILHQHHKSPLERHGYLSIKTMMEYETALPERLEPARSSSASHALPSASRTLLRLHRALEFIMLFMDGLIAARDDDAVSHVAQDAYRDSLARYHGWFIKKGAHLAMYTLPTKLTLMEKISKHSYGEVEGIARRMTAAMKPVYVRTEDLYSEFKLHDLP